jgi:hypothetical protein
MKSIVQIIMGAVLLLGLIVSSEAQNHYALLLNGSTATRFKNDLAFMYRSLVNRYGFADDEIYVLKGSSSGIWDPDSDGVYESFIAATENNVDSIFGVIDDRLEDGDAFVLFVSCHGGQQNTSDSVWICLANNGKLWDYELRQHLWNLEWDLHFDPVWNRFYVVQHRIKKFLTLEPCHSGGVIDDLRKFSDLVVATACKASEASYYPAGWVFNAFARYWVEAIFGADPWGMPAIGNDANNDGFVSLLEAFKYAKSCDPFAQEGGHEGNRETPQYMARPQCWFGSSKEVDGTGIPGTYFCAGYDFDHHDLHGFSFSGGGRSSVIDTLIFASYPNSLWIQGSGDPGDLIETQAPPVSLDLEQEYAVSFALNYDAMTNTRFFAFGHVRLNLESPYHPLSYDPGDGTTVPLSDSAFASILGGSEWGMFLVRVFPDLNSYDVLTIDSSLVDTQFVGTASYLPGLQPERITRIEDGPEPGAELYAHFDDIMFEGHSPAEPQADFIASTFSGIAPLTVDFTDLSSGEITERLWGFGDGDSTSQENPVHTFEEAGLYGVSLKVIGPGGTSVENKVDYIFVEEPTLVWEGSGILSIDWEMEIPEPTPFKDNTSIRFSVAKRGQVSLNVFDVSGRTVASLYQGIRNPGQYVVTWDGTNGHGDLLPMGLYFIRMNAEGFSTRQRTMILR